MDDALRKVVMQLQQQHGEASRQLSITRSQAAGREREKKISTLTLAEIEALPRSGATAPTCYKGVGRMFIQESRNSVENTLKAKEKEMGEELAVLVKKIKYLENEITTAQSSMRDILQDAQRASAA